MLRNHHKNIGVLGGTAFDSQLGSQIFIENGFNLIRPIWLSQTPYEQSKLYKRSSSELRQRCIDEIKAADVSEVVVYCTSLSLALSEKGWKHIENETGARMITLRTIYSEIACSCSHPAFIAADAMTAMRIAKELENRNSSICSLGYFDILHVQYFENKRESENETLSYFVRLAETNKCDLIIIGCTHYEKYPFEITTNLHVFRPGLQLINRFISANQIHNKNIKGHQAEIQTRGKGQ